MATMPAEFVAAVTGHELTGESALFEYLGPFRALMLPEATALAAFPPPPHGRILPGPVASSVNELVGSDVDALHAMIVHVFDITREMHCDLQVCLCICFSNYLHTKWKHMHPFASLQPRRRSWKLVQAAFEALVMNYEEHFNQGEMYAVALSMIRAWLAHFFKSNSGTTGAQYCIS